MRMLEKLKENDFDLETMKELSALVFPDFLDEDGNLDESRLATAGNEIFTDEVKAELSPELDELFDNADMESAEGVADLVCACSKVVVNKAFDTWLHSKLIEALGMETE